MLSIVIKCVRISIKFYLLCTGGFRISISIYQKILQRENRVDKRKGWNIISSIDISYGTNECALIKEKFKEETQIMIFPYAMLVF